MGITRNSTPEEKAAANEKLKAWRAANKERALSYMRKHRANNREKVREYTKKQSRRWYLKNKYGLTVEEYNKILEDQGRKCAICEITDPGASDWRVDHCHNSNKVRGLLCHNCNVSLGLLKDDTERMQRMIDYVRNHER